MKRFDRSPRIPAALAGLLLVLGLPGAGAAQYVPIGPGELPPLDAATRAAVVDSVAEDIAEVYVLGDAAARIVAHLKAQLAGGAYDGITDPVALAQQLERDAQATNHDGHFGIGVVQPAAPEADEDGIDPADLERRRLFMREMNYGFAKAEILPGNVGYLKLDMFADTDEAAETAIGAMNLLANAGALIIDLRRNGGGSASMIRLLATYLFPERVHLINWYQRVTDETVQSRTLDYVPGRRLTDVPVYVLTSRNTFSAAEEFTFDLKHLERATVVGDTTGGGGHTVTARTAAFDGFRVVTRLPYGRAYDPETGEGWEGVGVAPHIAVPAEQALETAHREALRARLETAEQEDIRARLAWAAEDLDSRLDPPRLTPRQLQEYVGRFGPRRVYLEDGVLRYQREDRPSYVLEPMAEDLFRVGDLDYFRLGFERDEDGRIVGVVGRYSSGREDRNARSES